MPVQTKTQQVFEILRRAIETGEIGPGERLNIRQLARRLGVSEIPVREAIRALEGYDLVRVTPYAGVVAAPISPRDFDETAEIRLLLEPVGARLATPHVTQADLAELSACLEAMEAAVARGDTVAYRDADRVFHQRIYDRCPNARLARLLSTLRDDSNRNSRVFRMIPHHAACSQAEHRAILAALSSRDAAAVERAVRQHRLGVVERLRPLVVAQAAQADPRTGGVAGQHLRLVGSEGGVRRASPAGDRRSAEPSDGGDLS